MAHAETVQDLVAEVEELGLVVASLQELRTMLDYKKLGVRVLQDIAQALRANGLGYFPSATLDANDMPRQYEEVRLFMHNSSLGKIVAAVEDPSPMNDQYLIEVSNSDANDAAETLDKIRTLLEPSVS